MILEKEMRLNPIGMYRKVEGGGGGSVAWLGVGGGAVLKGGV